jgi:hypothetical protein
MDKSLAQNGQDLVERRPNCYLTLRFGYLVDIITPSVVNDKFQFGNTVVKTNCNVWALET